MQNQENGKIREVPSKVLSKGNATRFPLPTRHFGWGQCTRA